MAEISYILNLYLAIKYFLLDLVELSYFWNAFIGDVLVEFSALKISVARNDQLPAVQVLVFSSDISPNTECNHRLHMLSV